ncbi:hypothetical protein SKAU_G00239280 [Synaphobranchus kaupii]|uniref:Glucocorticoid receptor n=1 Tax=Synaphobranchus kaupii TaxID=118154 RepID=A0A9Q1ITQ5_SYNKA|nr:hypothetical protein SKAU_G00239280 [Synaphobranchus kaupii]
MEWAATTLRKSSAPPCQPPWDSMWRSQTLKQLGTTRECCCSNLLAFSCWGENFSRLEASIADFNRSASSMDSLIGGADPSLFPLKTEDFSPMDRVELDLEQDTFEQVGRDSDLNQKLFNDNALDLLEDFELAGSPSQLNDFYVGDDAAFLSSLAVDDSLLGDISIVKQSKPVACGNGNNCTNVNGADQQQDKSDPVIKTEKDGYIQLCTPGVIKQEKESKRYCQMSGSDVPSLLSSSVSDCAVSTTEGQSCPFGVNASVVTVRQQDQKPVFNLYPALTTVGESWNRGQGYGGDHWNTKGKGNPIWFTFPC